MNDAEFRWYIADEVRDSIGPPMTLTELEHHEQVALLALLGLMARLDGQASGEEVELLNRIMSELGNEAFESAAREAAQLPDGEAILMTAGEVKRPEAREVLFELLFEMAVKESIVEREARVLDFLAETWELPQRAGD
jgi:hypothetical protein